MLRAGSVLATTGPRGAILVALTVTVADPLEAWAAVGAAPVRIEPDQDVVDAAFQLAALAEAADPAFRAFVIGAAFGAHRAMFRFAADQTVATIELWRPIASSRRYFQQAAFIAEARTARFVGADAVAALQTAGFA